MKYFFAFILLTSVAYGQSPYAADPYGKKITPARIPTEVENRTVRIGEMEIGEKVKTFPEAMVVDDNGQCWLNPRHVAFPLKSKGDLEITRNKLGYIVRINYKYSQINGYSVPRWPKWERGYVPSVYIPVKSVVIDKSNYRRLSPSQEVTKTLKSPYDPRYTVPQVPPNPYSLEKQNVRPRVEPRLGASRNEFILPELDQ